MAKGKIGEVLGTFGKEMVLPFISDLIALGMLGKGEKGKILTPESAQAILKRLAPHILGIGLADEALFNVALAKLEEGRHLEISRFLQTLSAHDRARFILAVTVLPDEKDRTAVLNMYSRLPVEEMNEVAKASRMISGTAGPVGALSEKAKQALEKIRESFYPWLAATTVEELETVFPTTAALVRRINERVDNPGWYGRLAKAIFR